MLTRGRCLFGAAALVLSAMHASAGPVCSPVMEWNQIALDATVTAGQGALPQIRSLAIVHTSMHDAVNTITDEYDTYLPKQTSTPSASPEAAAIAAAHYALTKLFPLQALALGG